jgi:glycosyltransferase involved in cell wall biosynthesis
MLTSSTLVSTSIIEGMSLVRLEALASGCCVVTTNTGGAHLFDSISRNGFFIVNSDIDAIGQAMLESLKPIYWLNSAMLARARIVENFNPEIIANSLIN